MMKRLSVKIGVFLLFFVLALASCKSNAYKPKKAPSNKKCNCF